MGVFNDILKTFLRFMSWTSVVFWPSTRPKNAIPRWCTGRKWHILMAVMRGNPVGGNWLMKCDEVKNSHGTLIDWCTGREWPVNCLTVISAWWRSNMRFQKSCVFIIVSLWYCIWPYNTSTVLYLSSPFVWLRWNIINRSKNHRIPKNKVYLYKQHRVHEF